MKIYVLEPNKKGYVKEIDGSLKSMQAVVGGPIEFCQPLSFDTNPALQEVAIICNEEGKLLFGAVGAVGAEPNFDLYTESGRKYDTIVGICFLCHAGLESEDLESIKNEEIAAFCAQQRH